MSKRKFRDVQMPVMERMRIEKAIEQTAQAVSRAAIKRYGRFFTILGFVLGWATALGTWYFFLSQ